MSEYSTRELALARLAAGDPAGSVALDALTDALGDDGRLSRRVELVSTLEGLERDGLVELLTDGGGPTGGVRCRLTDDGVERARSVRRRLLSSPVTLGEDGRERLPVREAADRLDESPVEVAATASDGVHPRGGTPDWELLGRDAELDRAEELREAVRGGEGRALLLTGPAGVGKTTLAERVVEDCRAAGFEVLRGRAGGDGDVPYQPLRDALSAFDAAPFADAGPEVEDPEAVAAQRTSLFADVTDLLAPGAATSGGVSPAGTADGDGGEDRGVADGTDAGGADADRGPASGDDAPDPRAEDGPGDADAGDGADPGAGADADPRVLYLDDLHLADEGTLAFLEYLFERLADHRLFVVGSYRPAELPAGAPVAPEAVGDSPAVDHRELAPLSVEGTRRLVEATLDARDPPEAFVRAVHERTGGTPLFVEETVRALAETDQVDAELDVYPTSAADIDVPAEVRETIDRRIRQFPEPARELLRWAAVLGEGFELDLLVGVADLPRRRLRTYLDTFVDSAVFTREDDRLAFRSEVIREALLSELDGDERRRRHARVADHLERAVEGDDAGDGRAATLAYHHRRAGDRDRAIAAYRRAADGAREVYAYETAAEHLRDALDLARDHDERTTVAVALELAAVHAALAEYDRAERLAEFARDRAEADGERRRALLELSKAATERGDHRRAVELAEEGLALGPDRGVGTDADFDGDVDDGSGRPADADADEPADADTRRTTCELLAAKSKAQRALSRYDEARATAERHRDLAARAGDDELRARALVDLGETAYERGEYDRAREHFRESLALCRAGDDRLGVARSLDSLGRVASQQGEFDRATDCYRESISLYREIGARHGVAECLNDLGTAAMQRGEFDRASQHFREALSLYEEIGARHEVAKCLNNRGVVAWNRGEFERAAEHFRESLSIRREVGDRHGVSKCLGNLGVIASRQGEFDRAHERFRESLEIDREVGARNGVAGDLNNLGQVATERGEYERAAEYLEESLSVARDIGRRRGVANAVHNLGDLAYELDDHEEARERFEESRSVAREIGYTSMLAQNAYGLGRMARERGEYDRAREELTEALELALGVAEGPTVTACRAELAATRFELADADADVEAEADLETAARTGEAAVTDLEESDIPDVGRESAPSLRALVEAAADHRAERAAEWCDRVLAAVGEDLDDEDREWFAERRERLRASARESATSE